MNKDPFEIMKNLDTLDPDSYSNLTGPISGIYVLFLNIATIGFVISCIICGLKLAWTRNPTARAQVKSDLAWKAVLTLIIFSYTFVADVIYVFTSGLV